MLDADNPAENQTAENSPEASIPAATAGTTAKKAAAKKAPAKKTTAAKKTAAKKTTTKKTAAKAAEPVEVSADSPAAAKKATAKKTTAKRAAKKVAPSVEADQGSGAPDSDAASGSSAAAPPATMLLFQPPDPSKAQPRKRKSAAEPETDDTQDPKAKKQTQKQTPKKATAGDKPTQDQPVKDQPVQDQPVKDQPGQDDRSQDDSDDDSEDSGNRRRRRRGGRRRRRSGDSDSDAGSDDEPQSQQSDDSGNGRDSARDSGGGDDSDGSEGGSASSRRRRRRRRAGDDDSGSDDPKQTVTRVRKPRAAEDEITALSGSTRLEAKKQRRREGREAGRRRAPIVSEAEFLARREAVERVMVIRQKKDLTQIAVLEDKVLVEHYVARESQTSLIGNVYLGRVQNVLPSMEAAFIDIGKGRNAVLYAGEVNWDALGAKGGQQRKIESVLKSGQPVLVQVSKDPIGHKGARLTSQISLPGRYLVYVPDGTTSGISRKLPDTERTRLKTLLKEIVPDTAGVIVRTAAEGASEEELTRDVERLTARWEDISGKVEGGNAPQLLYGEPDLTLKVVRDLFTEDFDKLVVSGDDAWDMVDDYVKHLAPDLEERLEKYDGSDDVFGVYRIDEQISKGMDRKVWLPSGGSLVIDRTEAMTVVDVNTGKFTGSGGNLEETVTKNNLEAAEEIVRQLRLRDIGGIIVVDFIDMVLESNRDLVLRRMVECLGRDRTRHQVAEVTSLGLVQMTRKRIGTGLLEAFSESCDHCGGRGLIVHHEPVEPRKKQDDEPRRNRRSGRNRGQDGNGDSGSASSSAAPSPKDIAAIAKGDKASQGQPDDSSQGQPRAEKPPASVVPAAEDVTDVGAAEPEVADKPIADKPIAEEASASASGTGSTDREVAPKKPATRKRSARRVQGPAGEPTVVSTADPAPADSAPVNSAPAAAAPAVDPVAEPASGSADGVPASAPAVVATVRRRGAARRPAGPPSGVAGSNGNPAGHAEGGAGGPDGVPAGVAAGVAADGAEPADPQEPAPAHVPVKKKGSRKH